MAFKIGIPGYGANSIIIAYGVARWCCQGRLKSVGPLLRMIGTVPGRRFRRGVIRLEAVARPGDLYHGAVIGKGPVAERDFGAGALQQRAGDENTEPEAGMLVLVLICAAPPRQI